MNFTEQKYYDILQENAKKNPGNLDFIYSSDFDVTEFLASHERLM